MEKAINSLIEKFFNKMTVNEKQAGRNLAQSHALLNALLPVLGYHQIEKIFKTVDDKNPKSINELKLIIAEITGLDFKILDEYLDPVRLTTYRKE